MFVLLGILIFVHELGHFLFAKTLGVKVERFSLGFGPKIVGFQRGETEYRISVFPLGGYVKMLGESNLEEEVEAEPLSEEDKKRAFNHQALWKRSLIVLAGPGFNILFAALVFMTVYMAGIPVPYPDIEMVPEGTPAYEAGLEEGDRVLAIKGEKVESYHDVDAVVQENAGTPLEFKVKRGERILTLTVTPELVTGQNLFGEEVEVGSIGVTTRMPALVGEVVSGKPADDAGLQAGDLVLGVDGQEIKTWEDMTTIVKENPGTPLHFVVLRDEERIETDITPEPGYLPGSTRKVGLIGIRSSPPEEETFIKRYGPVEATVMGFQKTADYSVFTVMALVKLIQRVIPAENLGGPILIFQAAGKTAERGLRDYVFFMAVISINLGIINLFPIPILDGGLLVFFGLEAVRRKPLEDRSMLLAQKIGLIVILAIMALAFYNDIVRVVTGKGMPW